MSKVLSLRVQDDLAEWADAYARERGVTRQALLEEGLRSFREDCERGVPEIRAQMKVVARGSGDCQRSPDGVHAWQAASRDERRSCVHCGRPGRDGVGETGGYFAEATMRRADLFSRLAFPASANGKSRA